MEKYLREIAKELQLIRKQLERENDLYAADMRDMQRVEDSIKKESIPSDERVVEGLNRMFNK